MFDKEFDDPANIHLLVVVEIEKPSKPPIQLCHETHYASGVIAGAIGLQQQQTDRGKSLA